MRNSKVGMTLVCWGDLCRHRSSKNTHQVLR